MSNNKWKYEDEVWGIPVFSDYPIDHDEIKDELDGCVKAEKAVITSPVVDENWDFGETVGELIEDLKKLPKDMPVETNWAGMGVRTDSFYDDATNTIYMHSSLTISDQE